MDTKRKLSEITADPLELSDAVNHFLLSEERIAGALVGISVKSASDGSDIYEKMSHTRLSPASNMKLLTAAAALTVLGPDYRFTTELLTDGVIDQRVLRGNLYLKGKGDPTLLISDLEQFAEKLKGLGVDHIDGHIIGDDTWYDDVRLSPDMIWSDEHFYYGSQISALTVSPDEDYDTGTVVVTVTATQAGNRPTIDLSPQTDYVRVFNHAHTSSTGSEEDLMIRRVHGKNDIIVEGSIPIAVQQVQEWIAVWEPTAYVMHLFQDVLKSFGITWAGDVRHNVSANIQEMLGSITSEPLATILIPFMKLSNNGHGEMLVKEMGKFIHQEGSWERGLAVLKETLGKLNINTDSMVIRDGSGISHATLIPVNEITQLLYVIQAEAWFSHFLTSLPLAGHDERMVGGTLKDRLKHLTVQAKTGTIDGVSTLSGYLKANREEDVIFSLFLNHLLDEEDGPEILDQLIELIVKHV